MAEWRSGWLSLCLISEWRTGLWYPVSLRVCILCYFIRLIPNVVLTKKTNSAVRASSLIPEYSDVIFRGISHFRTAKFDFPIPHSMLSRWWFSHFHLLLLLLLLSSLLSSLAFLFSTSRYLSLILSSCIFHFHRLKPRAAMSAHNSERRKHVSIRDSSSTSLNKTLRWKIRRSSRYRFSNSCSSWR
jgi:hypothetical protein